jgi:hypothetical protein
MKHFDGLRGYKKIQRSVSIEFGEKEQNEKLGEENKTVEFELMEKNE